MNIGTNIRHYREKYGITQEELADKANISRVAIGSYERGIRIPNTKFLIKISNALGVSYEQLIDGTKIVEDEAKQCMTKQEFDEHTKLMIANLIRDQTAHNIDRWGAMHNFHEMYALGLEEHEEAQEQLHWLSLHKTDMWNMIKANEPDSDIRYCLEIIIEYMGFAVQELIHEAAVYQRALDTIQNEKAHTTDQSKCEQSVK